ncbi:hypothetical protein HZH66_014652 [Vespula vulgaris]|uniref:Uncharacterized protein n=1 Tax=Vespula vulgaris TaxID=7454 RepID=A0A834MP99_VESVU|nr:hypothetical protein HZH66_014652 [Vespula vulgaris]
MTDASIPTIHVRQVHGLILTTSTPRFKSSQPPYQKEVSLEISASRRTCDVVEIKIINNEVKTGYIPSLNLGDNIYVDKAIVTNLEELEIADKHDVLSLEHNVHMSEMQEFSPSVTSPLARIHSKDCNEGLGDPNRNKTVNSISSSFQIDHASKTISKTFESEYEQVLQYIKLGSLNKEETEVVKRMIMDSADLFHLPDQLGSVKYFDTFDLASGFYQIPMSEKDAEKPPLLRHTSITNLYEYTLD